MDTEMIHSIFITNSECQDADISGKVTTTSVLDTIPKQAVKIKMENWEKTYNTEWRWRFLEINDNKTVEISYYNKNSVDRIYYNKYGEWVTREVPKEYDIHVVETYYYYS